MCFLITKERINLCELPNQFSMSSQLPPPSTSNVLSDDDVAFIRRKLRYPINTFRKVVPFMFVIFFIGVYWFIYYELLQVGTFARSKIFPQLFPFSISGLIITFAMIRYVRSLFFEKFHTGLRTADNIRLLESFFIHQQVRHHTIANYPDVLIVNSVMNGKGNEQEIVVFIAIDNTILINSHISTSNIFPRSKRKYKELLSMLKSFLSRTQTDLTRTV